MQLNEITTFSSTPEIYGLRKCETGRGFVFVSFTSPHSSSSEIPLDFSDRCSPPSEIKWRARLSELILSEMRGKDRAKRFIYPGKMILSENFPKLFLALFSQRCWKAFLDDFPMFSQRKEFVYLSILGNRIALEFKVPIARMRRSKNGPRRVSRIENDFLSLGGPGSKTPTQAFLNMS